MLENQLQDPGFGFRVEECRDHNLFEQPEHFVVGEQEIVVPPTLTERPN